MLMISNEIKFDWDAGNSNKSLKKHEVNDEEAEQVFFNPPLVRMRDEKHSQREERFLILGKTDEGKHLSITITHRDDKVRIISARPMSRKEREFYANYEK